MCRPLGARGAVGARGASSLFSETALNFLLRLLFIQNLRSQKKATRTEEGRGCLQHNSLSVSSFCRLPFQDVSTWNQGPTSWLERTEPAWRGSLSAADGRTRDGP